jgi:hypothetical protein
MIGGRSPVLPRSRLVLRGAFARRARSFTLLLQAGLSRCARGATLLSRAARRGEPAAPPDFDGALAAYGFERA